MDVHRFKQLPVLGILRCDADVAIEELVGAVISSGLTTIEIAMNSVNAASLIRRAIKAASGRLTVGAGTVVTPELLADALDAGATFVVMPVLIGNLVTECVRKKIPVFPGALTPQEIYNAWNAGATMVKVFPAGVFGPAYFKEIKAPLPGIELLACGGVTPENAGLHFKNGASAIAFGSSIFRKEWLQKHDFKRIEESVKSIITASRSAINNP